MNQDGTLDVVDIVQLVSIIINGFSVDFVTIPEGVYYAPGSNENIFVESILLLSVLRFLVLFGLYIKETLGVKLFK